MKKQHHVVPICYLGKRNQAQKLASLQTRKAFLMKLAFLFLISFSVITAKASHLVGGEISYTKIGSVLQNRYHVKLTLYRDCGGINLTQTADVTFTNPGSGTQGLTLQRTGVITDISLVCPGQFSNCQGGNNPGVQRFIYEGDITLTGNINNATTIVYDVCCRPNGVNTLTTPGSQEMCITANIPPFSAALHNNSAVFVNPPIAVFCQGQPATLALNAFDSDGDVLRYFLVSARQSVAQNCNYVSPLNGTNPIHSVAPASININTGVITFTPTTVERAVLAIRVDEYRGGIKIGEVYRDMEVSIKTCSGNTAPVVAPINNAVAQVGQTICIPVHVTDAQAQNLTVTATGGIVPPATLTLASSGPGFYNGNFCFTPTAAHAGNTFSISINANDGFCPVPAASVGSFNITVPAPCNVSVSATATPTTCGLANGTATASMTGGVIPYTFNWTGPNAFVSNDQNITNLQAGTYSITIVDGNNCVESSVVMVANNGSTIIVNGTVADATCGLDNGSITLNPTGGIAPYLFSLNAGPAQASNLFSNLPQGAYTVTVTDANNCTNSDVYTVSAANDITPPNALCQNFTAYLDHNGDVNISTSDIDNGSNDNCSGVTLSVSPTSFDCGNLGDNTVTLTVTDASQNVSTCNAIVTVLDTIKPDLHCQNATLYLDANGHATVTVADVLDHDHEACPVDTTYLSQYDFTCANVGQNNVIVYGEDNSGNIGECTALVTVIDTIRPTISCASDVVAGTDPGQCGANITLTAPSTADNCAVLNVTSNAPAFFSIGVTSVLWTVTDVNGNTNTCTQAVTVNDLEDPSISCAANVTVSNDPGVCHATVALANPDVNDNCGIANVANNAPPVFPVGLTSVEWVVTDVHGRTAICTQTVTVNDNENPTITCSPNVTVSNAPGSCSANVLLTPPTTGDNCGVASVTSNEPASYPVGVTNVLWTVTDVNGNSNTCTQTVTVNDTENPTVICKNFTLSLSGGTGTVQAVNIDNGSTDNCGIASSIVSPNTFTCADAGDQQVTLTVTDMSGNIAVCTATVTVQYVPSCNITVIPANNIYTGGVPNNIYLGYGPQSATLQSNASGGTGFTYNWAPQNNLNCYNCANPVFTPTVAGTTTYTVTVTNSNGCTTQCLVTMCVINAVATGKGNNGKVIICHVPPGNANNPQTLSISPNAVASHLTGHAGDQLGACGQSCGAAKGMDAVEGQLLENNGFETIVYPNPTNSDFTIVINAESKGAVQAAMYDMLGKKITDLKGMEVNVPYTVDQPLSSGIYFIHIQHNGYTQSVRLIKQDQ